MSVSVHRTSRSSICINPSQKDKGICSVCHVSRLLHMKDGNVHQHGPRSKPCLGSNKPPLSHLPLTNSQLSARDTATRPTTTSCSEQRCDETAATSDIDQRLPDIDRREQIKHPSLQHNLLRHIPKGARSSTALLLADVINRLISDPTQLHCKMLPLKKLWNTVFFDSLRPSEIYTVFRCFLGWLTVNLGWLTVNFAVS
jgi:hypothetical protein